MPMACQCKDCDDLAVVEIEINERNELERRMGEKTEDIKKVNIFRQKVCERHAKELKRLVIWLIQEAPPLPPRLVYPLLERR